MKKAAGCVIVKDDSILLLHRIDKDWLELPGGKAEPNESLDITAVREFKEELGASVVIKRKLGNTIFRSIEFELDYSWFLGELENEKDLRIGEPVSFDWFKYIPITDLRKYNLSTNMQNLINDIEKKKIVL